MNEDTINEDLTHFPSTFQMARNAVKQGWTSTKGVFQGKAFLASAEKAAARLKICEGCKYYKDDRCLQCGCFMHAKVHMELTMCPVGKWTDELLASEEALTRRAEHVALSTAANGIKPPVPQQTNSVEEAKGFFKFTPEEEMEVGRLLKENSEKYVHKFEYKDFIFEVKFRSNGERYVTSTRKST